MSDFFADCINFALETVFGDELVFLVDDFFTDDERRHLVEVVFDTEAEEVLPVLRDLRMTCFSELEPVVQALALFFLGGCFDMTRLAKEKFEGLFA